MLQLYVDDREYHYTRAEGRLDPKKFKSDGVRPINTVGQ